MDRNRLKYLMKQVLGVDVEAIARQVTASLAIERARQVSVYSKEWASYMEKEGGIVLLPRNVTDVGKKPRSGF